MIIKPEVTWIVLVSIWTIYPLYNSLECYILGLLKEYF